MAVRMYWVDREWKRISEAVVVRAVFQDVLNDAGRGSVTTTQVPDGAEGLVVYLEDGQELWRGRIVSLQGREGEDEVVVSLADLKALLGQYLVWPEPNGNFSTQAYDTFSGPATSAILHYVDRNAGPSALAWRQMGITLAADPGLGETIKVNARFDRLLSLLREIADLGGVRFRFQGLTFVADAGVTHNDIVFAEYAGTVERLVWRLAAPKATAVVAAGSGEGTTRLIQVVQSSDLGRWGVRERFWDVRNISNVTDLHILALQWLASRKSGYSATVRPTLSPRTDIRPGDTIRVWANGGERAMVVQSVTWRLDGWEIQAAERNNIRPPGVVDLGLRETQRRVELLSTK